MQTLLPQPSMLIGEPSPAAEAAEPSAVARRAAAWPMPVVLTIFWIYVTASNVLYATGMSASTDPGGTRHLFASWDARVLQHVMLYPILAACLWSAVRIGWRPLWRAAPAQGLLALSFAALAGPMLWVAEFLLKDKPSDLHHDTTMLSGLASDMPMWVASGTSFLLTYGFALALVSGIAIYRRFKEAELRSKALENAWSDARLAALRMQLSPHTLFNLLHTIRGQIAWDPPSAQTMIVQLGDLLRRLLSAGERDFVLLRQELEFVQLYLELQRQRFADRLLLSLPDPASAAAAWVPSLILQPLIENAVTHGLANHSGPVTIEVRAFRDGRELVLSVTNTTAARASPNGERIGLSNVRERLAVHFGPRARLTSTAAQPEQWHAEVRLPFLADAPHRDAAPSEDAAA